MKIGDITASYIRLLLHSAEQMGANTGVLLARVGLTAAELRDPDARIDLTTLMKLGAYTIRDTGNPALGLEMGRNNRVSDMALPGLLAMTSATVDEALDMLLRFEILHSRCYRGASRYDRSSSTLHFYSIAPYNEFNRFVVDSLLLGWQTLLQWMTGKNDLVEAVHIEFPAPDYAASYADYFSAPVMFSAPGSLLQLKSHAGRQPSLYAEPLLQQQLLATAEARLKRLEIAETFRGRVQAVLGPLLHRRDVTLEQTALLLGMPDWTLRRKLKDEGCTFQSLLDDMRKDLALGYMRDTQMSFGEIAYVLGFSTPGAFQRAFKRWTGDTPGDYRRRISLSGRQS